MIGAARVAVSLGRGGEAVAAGLPGRAGPALRVCAGPGVRRALCPVSEMQAAADGAADPATLERVQAALLSQLAGRTVPAAAPFTGPGEQLEHRTCTLLAPVDDRRRP